MSGILTPKESKALWQERDEFVDSDGVKWVRHEIALQLLDVPRNTLSRWCGRKGCPHLDGRRIRRTPWPAFAKRTIWGYRLNDLHEVLSVWGKPAGSEDDGKLSPDEAAAVLGVHRAYLCRLAKRHKLARPTRKGKGKDGRVMKLPAFFRKEIEELKAKLQPVPIPDGVMSVSKAARELKVNPSIVHQWLRNSRSPHLDRPFVCEEKWIAVGPRRRVRLARLVRKEDVDEIKRTLSAPLPELRIERDERGEWLPEPMAETGYGTTAASLKDHREQGRLEARLHDVKDRRGVIRARCWYYLQSSLDALFGTKASEKTPERLALPADLFPLQKAILLALEGAAKTADDLESVLKVDRRTLFYGGKRDGTGGLKELCQRGLVRAGKRGRHSTGYWRPDCPPSK